MPRSARRGWGLLGQCSTFCTVLYTYPMADREREMGILEARQAFSRLVHEAAVHGTVTYITNRGKRVAMIGPLPESTPHRRRRPPSLSGVVRTPKTPLDLRTGGTR